ncbi:MAG: beta-ketoacyl-ACP synthase III [Candidatus Omnitrophota bacterium]|nr:beta-ketoacyl-ACP synthase III [Candidatus Omnitrophota bacterium]
MQQLRTAAVTGVGIYLPEKILTNADLEKMVNTSNEWIISRTGIKERRIATDDQASSDLAANASKEALLDAGVEPDKIDLIIITTVTPDMQFPSTACLVREKIGAKNAAAFDLGAACAGFAYGLTTAQQFIATGTYDTVLVIGVEKLSSVTDWQDRSTCVLLGDGAGAAILAPAKGKDGIMATYLGADGSMAELLKVPAGGSRQPSTRQTIDERQHYLKMKGNELFRPAVRMMVDAAENVLKKCGLTTRDVGCLVPHQANIRIIKAVAQRLKIPMDRVFVNIQNYGNISSASTAIALYEAVKFNKIKKGSIVVIVGFGSGLTSSACVIKW